jgi:epoxyqueuosine reductase
LIMDGPPPPRFTDLFPDVSGNTINGLGETEPRRASRFFWHPPDSHAFGALQKAVINHHRQSPPIAAEYSPTAGRGPPLIEVVTHCREQSAEANTAEIKAFALDHEADLVGIADMSPMFVFDGYEIEHPTVIMIGVAHDYSELSQAPGSFANPTLGKEVAKQYNRAARVSRAIANYIRAAGYNAEPYPGPFASALLMIPAAIAAGLGELGKHGSMINEKYGSGFRLAGITTNMPLLADEPVSKGVDDFCTNCQVCTNACPPGAISDTKQWVSGVEKYYVNFDKCIPYFGEALSCGLCIAVCPWTRPGVADNLVRKMAARRQRANSSPRVS